ncbi:MAG: YCF48-related protein [Ignavibacteriales bacterium]|nr:YCF48-related protein [Ignavibacteriales bacterium]
MKKLSRFLSIFLFLYLGSGAEAQVTNLTVNGVSSNFTMVQGDSLKWEYNLPVGGSAKGEFWIDLNGNGVIDPASDKQLFGTFTQTDGQSGDPGDMDGLVNGHIFFVIESFGLPPAKYILKFSNNGIEQSVVGTFTALPSPTYTVSGVVTVPGASAQNIYVAAQNNNGQWGALTDAGGNYTINFNASAGGLEWRIQPLDEIPPYSQPTEINITLTGNFTGINFPYSQSAATVVGYLKGEDGHVFANVGVYSQRQQYGGNGKDATTDANGFFQFGYSLSEITSNSIWSIQANSDGIAPGYFPPRVNAISLHQYDNLRIDLTAYVVDDSITGRVTLDGQAPGGTSFRLFASAQDNGQTNAYTDPNTGNFTFYVTRMFSNYYLGIDNLPQNYGYDRNIPQVQPGDKNVIINVATIAWLPQTSNTSNSLKSVSFVNTSTGWVGGSNGTMLKTTNAGVTWSNQTTLTSHNINGIYFFSTSTGWLVGDGGIIKKTTDGGDNWTSQNSTTAANLQAVQFFDENIGWTIGGTSGQGVILKTTNGGTTWSSYAGINQSLYSLSMVDANTGWVVGSGEILKTIDGGATWNSQFTTSNTLYSVLFADAYIGGAVGGYGYTYSTTDGGTNWTPKPNYIGNFRCLCGINSLTIWVVGENSNIYKSTDGGLTWAKQLTNNNYSNTNFYDAQFVDANNGWVVGDNGTILRTTCGGVVTSVWENRSDEIPRSFLLSQNYPNPFNPSTIISFSLPTQSFTSLKVFDLLGREVTTIVSEEMAAGSYMRTWNAEGLPSGIYFYRLQADNFSETKKLMVIK